MEPAARRDTVVGEGIGVSLLGAAIGLLLGVIVILYLLQYFPALSLGPVVEHFEMLNGKTF